METDKERARGLFGIITDGEPITEESKEYAGYGDETSARVASYNYTSVEKTVGFKYKHGSRIRKRAERDLRKLLRRSDELNIALESGDAEITRYKYFLEDERREALSDAAGCLITSAIAGWLIGYLAYQFFN